MINKTKRKKVNERMARGKTIEESLQRYYRYAEEELSELGVKNGQDVLLHFDRIGDAPNGTYRRFGPIDLLLSDARGTANPGEAVAAYFRALNRNVNLASKACSATGIFDPQKEGESCQARRYLWALPETNNHYPKDWELWNTTIYKMIDADLTGTFPYLTGNAKASGNLQADTFRRDCELELLEMIKGDAPAFYDEMSGEFQKLYAIVREEDPKHRKMKTLRGW